MRNVYIVGACRTAIGSFLGSLKDTTAVELGTHVIKEAIKRAEISVEDIDQVIMGNVLQAGQGQNPARQAAIYAGIPVEVPAVTINRVCASSLTAMAFAMTTIRAGEAECIVAGGMESMSNAPYVLPKLRQGQRMGNGTAVDTMIHDGLWEAMNDYHMGITAENIVDQYKISREEQDQFAFNSQKKASKALQEDIFKDEITPFPIKQRRGEDKIFQQDEYVRVDTELDKLGKLRGAFKSEGTVTAGNSSGINDGAAAMLVVSEEFLKKHNLKPLAKIVGTACCGVDPKVMGLGPIPAVKEVLRKTNLTIEDIDLFELNEAFAAQSIAVARDLGLESSEKVNVNGGAIALGHPIGASGARISTTLLYELNRSKGKYGIATLCIGGGMGEAILFERDTFC